LGKDHIYILSLAADEIHENEAAAILAQALAGQGVRLNAGPDEGKIHPPPPPATGWQRPRR